MASLRQTHIIHSRAGRNGIQDFWVSVAIKAPLFMAPLSGTTSVSNFDKSFVSFNLIQISNDIRLGDVVISKPTTTFGGVVQYDLGKYSTAGGFERTRFLGKPPPILWASAETLAAYHRIKGSRAPQYLSDMLQQFPAMEEEYSHPGAQEDQLLRADYPHPGGRNCHNCDKHRTVERDYRRNKNPQIPLITARLDQPTRWSRMLG